MAGWRRLQPQFPVMPWSDLVEVVRDQVNPLAGAEHVLVVMHQLQLMGEVSYSTGQPAAVGVSQVVSGTYGSDCIFVLVVETCKLKQWAQLDPVVDAPLNPNKQSKRVQLMVL